MFFDIIYLGENNQTRKKYHKNQNHLEEKKKK